MPSVTALIPSIMDRTLLFYFPAPFVVNTSPRSEQSRVRDAQANRRLMDRLDQKYPQWTKPVHGTTYTNGLRLGVSTTKKPIRPTLSTSRRRHRRYCVVCPLSAGRNAQRVLCDQRWTVAAI